VDVAVADHVDRRLPASLTLVCALAIEEKAARRAGVAAARVGLGATGVLPEGDLVSFGLAGALVEDLDPGQVICAARLVDRHGATLWEGVPLGIPGSIPAVVCASDRIVDSPAERKALAHQSGALAVDMESAVLARSGRLAAIVRVVSDCPGSPLGRLAGGSHSDGTVAWGGVARAFAASPLASFRSSAAARKAVARLAEIAPATAGATS
jgi:4-hydroxy-3-methylbut-2-enyl diphosphate reductase